METNEGDEKPQETITKLTPAKSARVKSKKSMLKSEDGKSLSKHVSFNNKTSSGDLNLPRIESPRESHLDKKAIIDPPLDLTKTEMTKAKDPDSLPKLIKHAEMAEETSKAPITCFMNSTMTYQDHCNLKEFKDYVDGALIKGRKKVRSFVFEGIEPLTDLFFYILNKHYSGHEMWSLFEAVNIDSCRYITDFGIELLATASRKPRFLEISSTNGCQRLFKYLHLYVDIGPGFSSQDLFQSKHFTQCTPLDTPASSFFSSYKICIQNETSLRILNTIDSSQEKKSLMSYTQLIEKRDDGNAVFNIYEVNSTKFPLLFNTTSSVLMICVELTTKKKLVNDLINKFMQHFHKGNEYLKTIVVVIDEKQELTREQLLKLVVDKLESKCRALDKEEETLETQLAELNFYEQETLRDKLRLKFYMQKLINSLNSLISNFQFVMIKEKDKHTIESLIDTSIKKNLTEKRIRSQIVEQMSDYLASVRKYDRRVIPLEDFIDDCYSNEQYNFKLNIQTESRFRNIVDEFFQHKHLLGECIYIKTESGESLFITDVKWFFEIVDKIFQKMDSMPNEYCFMKYDHLKSQDIFTSSKQLDSFISILTSMNILMKLETEKFKYLVARRSQSSQIENIEEIWPSVCPQGSLQITTLFNLYFWLPELVLNQILAKYLLLPKLCHLSERLILIQEGCSSVAIIYHETKNQIELSLRTADISKLIDESKSNLANTGANVQKCLFFLFNEYKTVIEAVLFRNSMPFYIQKETIQGLTPYPQFHTNINIQEQPDFLEILDTFNHNRKEWLTVDHRFQVLNQFDVNAGFMQCAHCGINSLWSKCVYDAYRDMYPMVKSESPWSLQLILSNVVASSIKPEKKAVSSIFEISNERSTFIGFEKMSPFNFDRFAICFANVVEADSIRVGVCVKRPSKTEDDLIWVNCRTRRLNYLSNQELVRAQTQRYAQRFKVKIPKLPMNFASQQAITVEQKNQRVRLMEEIMSLGSQAGSSVSNLSNRAESWVLNSGDQITVRLFKKEELEGNIRVVFFYNNEMIGETLIDKINECTIHPYTEFEGSGMTRFFFDLSRHPFNSELSKRYSIKPGMYLEMEYQMEESVTSEMKYSKTVVNEDKFIAPAYVKQVEEGGRLLISREETNDGDPDTAPCWIEPSSKKLHPCGYWNYISSEKNRVKDPHVRELRLSSRARTGLIKYATSHVESGLTFDWHRFFTDKQLALPVPFEVFVEEQRNGMSDKWTIRDSRDKKRKMEYHLECDLPFNPRRVWSLVRKMNENDITDIYRQAGIIAFKGDAATNSEFESTAIVLFPTTVDSKFINYPNVATTMNLCNLNVSCTHRDEVKIMVGDGYFICINYPHLIKEDSFNLVDKSVKLELRHLLNILVTSYDLGSSLKDPLFPNFRIENWSENESKTVNESLRTYFERLACLVSLVVPVFFESRCRLERSTPVIQYIIEAFAKEKTNKTSGQIEEYIMSKAKLYGIDQGGLCKFCGVLNLNAADIRQTQTRVDKFIKKTLKSNDEYSKIITSLKLVDSEYELTQDSGLKSHVSLTNSIFKHLPNLSILSVQDVRIKELEDSIQGCPNMKQIELVNNDLKELPNNFPPLTQVVIDNNPLKTVPTNLFCIESLRSLVLNRLNIDSLPDNWLELCVDNICNIRSIHISQTNLRKLPDDLILGSKSLQQLTFQGVHLILPDNENQWSLMTADLNKVYDMYCPNLLTIQEATQLFEESDSDKNGVLDYKDLQHFNALIFKRFPRAGDQDSKKNMRNQVDDTVSENVSLGLPAKAFFVSSALTYLDLSFQAFIHLPGSVKHLRNLKILKLRYCVLLESLSPKLGLLRLKELDLTGCYSLKTPPLEIQRRGINSILAYLNRLMTGSVECKRTKLMFTGLGGAGKTSLMTAMLEKVYQKESKSNKPNITDGITIRDWKIDLKKMKKMNDEDSNSGNELVFSVFDFAGQVVYYNTHQFFLTKRSIFLLVWNVRLGAQHSGLEFWLNSISCHAPQCPIFLVGTHIDEVSKYEIGMEKLKADYPQIAGFYFVSSYDGTGIESMVEAIIDKALGEVYMGEKIPKCWLDFESALQKLKSQVNLLDYEEVEKIASNSGIFDKAELTQALQFLHDLGSIIHFNKEFLKDKVIINSQYMIDLMACLVSVNNNFITDGKLRHSDVQKIWKDYEPSLHQWILKVTEEFDLTFAVPDQSINLVPCLMPDTPSESINWMDYEEGLPATQKFNSSIQSRQYSRVPKASRSSKKETKILYEFAYLPAGLFNRAQVRLFQITDNKVIWRYGSLLKKNNHLALITCDGNKIKVEARGLQPENLIFLIHEVIETLIAESFNGVDYDFYFPCPDCFDMGSIDIEKSMLSASLVRQATRLKTVFLQCRNYFHAVPLADLHSKMPPDSVENYDLQISTSIRDLKYLKQKLSYETVVVYSSRDADLDEIIHPRVIKQDLEKSQISCWYTETPDSVSSDSMAIILRNSSLVLFCITDNFCHDTRCQELFEYSKSVLNKPYVLVVLGSSFEWQKTQVGAQIAHEFFIKINTIERYKTAWPDLLDLTRKRLKELNKSKDGRKDIKQCFISYCRVNSHDAVAKGTPLKSQDSLGWGDPRALKTYLEKEGFSVWIDYEQVGGKKNLFEDIVEGIRNASLVIACISNEYAMSENCMKEFRFASNLKVPILICTFGSANRKSEWKNTELGIISCLNNKEINFQLENQNAYSELLAEVRSLGIEPVNKTLKELVRQATEFSNEDESNDTKMAYTELIELAQRKFLRQIAGFADTGASKPFPRLFIVDLLNNIEAKKLQSFSPARNTNTYTRMSNMSSMMNTSNNDKTGKYCIRAMCECESGWHPSGEPIEYENLPTIPEMHYAYLFRAMNLIKIMTMSLDILSNSRKLDELLDYIEEHLSNAASSGASPGDQNLYTSQATPQRRNMDNIFSFKDSLNSLKAYLILQLDQLATRNVSTTNETKPTPNINRIEHFALNRCLLPSGKILWLCDKHSQEEHIQVLTSAEDRAITQYQNDEYSMLLLEELQKMS